MSTAKVLAVTLLAFAAAGCGQLSQSKSAPPAGGETSANAPASTEAPASTDGKPADDAAGKPAAPAQAPAGAQPDKPS